MEWQLNVETHPVTLLPYYNLILPSGKEVGLHPMVFQIFNNQSPILVIDGGRSGGKSIAAAQAFILKASGMAAQYKDVPPPPLRTLVIRESVNSLKNSVMASLWGWVEEFELQDSFVMTGNEIRQKYNKSLFVFRGLKTHTRTAVRSFHNFHYCWIEEGQEITVPVWEDIEPTIRRKGQHGWNGRFIITMNRAHESDAIDSKVIQKIDERDDAVRLFRNYTENPFRDAEINSFIEGQRRLDPVLFKHVWLGEPDDGAKLPILITPKMVEGAFLAYVKFKERLLKYKYPHTKAVGGLDIAGMGENNNCLAIRRGPVVESVETWNKTLDHVTYRRVYDHCVKVGCSTVHFDVSGVGQGFQARHVEARDEHFKEYTHYPLKAVPENNGSAVTGKDKKVTQGITNEASYQYRGDQMAQMLVVRLQNTERLLDGVDVPLSKCLFFSDHIDDYTKNRIRRMLTQPTIEYDKRRRMHVKKMDKKKGQESPDEFDAVRLAFAPDSQYGIVMREWT